MAKPGATKKPRKSKGEKGGGDMFDQAAKETAAKKSASKGTEAQPTQSLTDKQMLDYYERSAEKFDEMTALQAKVSKLRGSYRGILKDAKKAGIDPADIIWRIQCRDRDVVDIDRETAARNRLARVTRLPLGAHLGMSEDRKTVAEQISMDLGEGATKTDQKALLAAASADGLKAGKSGRTRTENPWPLKSKAFKAWDDQWIAGQKEIGGEMSGVGRKAAPEAADSIH